MKKIGKSLVSFVLAIGMCLGVLSIERSASTEVMLTDAAEGNYYSSITATSGSALLGQLHDLITSSRTKYTSYDDCKTPDTVMQTDPGTANNPVRDFYTQENIASKWNGNDAGTWNREHVWAQSLSYQPSGSDLWGTSGGGSDLQHIRPSEVRLNGTRGNHTFGEANGGTPAYYKDSNGNNKYVGGYVSGDTFEPLDKVKGDVARIIMYVYTHYNTYSNSIFGNHATTNGTKSGGRFGTLNFKQIMSASNESDAIKLLLEWNAADEVDDIERTRNEAAYSIQGNRNPFIDHPEYADAIWGNGSVTPGPGGDTTVTLTGLTMSASSLSLTVGQSSTLSVTPTPSNASSSVTWSTSSSSVATVSNGTVKAVGAGTATITATSTVTPSITATATVTVTAASSTPSTGSTVKIDINSFNLTDAYGFKSWSAGGINGMAFIYGGNTSSMQFNRKQSSYYLASTSAAPGPIQSVTVKSTSESTNNDWKLLTSTSAYGEVTGKPTNGNDQGVKTVTTSGVTWTLSGNDTYFALTFELNAEKGASYLDSITVTYGGGNSQGGGSTDTLTGLTLSPASLALTVGQSQTLSVTATPSDASNAVTWSTSNSSVATVTNGNVTAVGTGSATITATSTVNKSIMATAQVTVTKASSTDPTPSTGNTITINLNSFNLTEGYGYKSWSAGGVSGTAFIFGGTADYPAAQGMQFNVGKSAYYLASTTATPEPIKSVTVKSYSGTTDRDWKLLTSSTAYGEVAGKPTNGNDQGTKTVTPSGVTWTLSGNDTYFALTFELDKLSGAAYLDSITVTYGDGSSSGGGSTDTLTGLTLSPASLALTVGQSQTLSVTATPSGASNSVTWSTSNPSVASVANGKVTAVGEGTATITATSTVNNSITATAQVTVTKASSTDPTPPTGNKITININSFDLTDGYGFKSWSAGGINGTAFIYGGSAAYDSYPDYLQFNKKQSSYYLASTSATPGAIRSITVKATSTSTNNDWKLLTSTSPYGEVSGKPTNGNDQGTKTVTASGVTWTLSGNDTYFALTFELDKDTGAGYLDSIIIEYGESSGENPGGNQGGGDIDNAKVTAFHNAVAGIVTSGSLNDRLASINAAITAYRALSADEKASAANDVALLEAAINNYNAEVRARNADANKANGALYGG